MDFLKNMFGDNSAHEVSVQDVESAIASGDHVILDVREQDEWDSGHIAEAVHIPLGDLPARAAELDSSTPIYTICRSGKRSIAALEALEAAGHKAPKSMAGGMFAWAEAGKPMTS